MQLGNAHLWWILLLVPLFFGFLGRRARLRQQKLTRLADAGLLPQLIPGFSLHRRARRLEDILIAAALPLLLFALLRPQWGYIWKPTEKRGVDIVVAVDVSESMLAQDIRPNRLTRARREIQDLLETVQGDRLGLVSFAGTAYVECPLTLDYGAFRMFLSELSPALIPVKGTNIEAAILEGIAAFDRATGTAEETNAKLPRDRALLLITDGEDFEGDLQLAARRASESKVKIYILGIGTAEGAPIPTDIGHKRDQNGTVIVSRLNQGALEQLATDTGGVYVTSISSDRDTEALYRLGIRRDLAAQTLEWNRGKLWNEYYQWPLLLGMLLLIGAAFLRARGVPQQQRAETPIEEQQTPEFVAPLLVFMLLCGLPGDAQAQSSEEVGKRAREAFERGEFEDALKQFSEAAASEQENFRLKLGEGASHYRLQQFDEARNAFLDAAKLAPNEESRAQALYNAANSMVQLQELKEAIAHYEEALKLSPQDREAAENLQYTRKLLKEQQQKQQQQKQQDQNQRNEENQEEQQQDQEQQQDPQNSDNRDQSENQSQGQPPPQPQPDQQKNQQDGSGQPEPEEPQQQKQDSDQSQSPEEKEQEQEREDASPQSGQGGEDQQNGEQEQPQGGRADQSEKTDQLEAQLETIEEGNSKRMKHRFERGLQQLKQLDRRPPEKDW